MTILGNKVAPWAADIYLALTGYEGQQTGDPVGPDRPDNLFEPVPGDHGAHGVFDEEAYDRSLQFWATRNRRWLALAGTGLAGAAALVAARRKD